MLKGNHALSQMPRACPRKGDEMPYMGMLKQTTATVIEISNGEPDNCGYTILKISHRDKIASADHNTIAAGATSTFNDSGQ